MFQNCPFQSNSAACVANRILRTVQFNKHGPYIPKSVHQYATHTLYVTGLNLIGISETVLALFCLH